MAWIGLGSNLGNSWGLCSQAIERLKGHPQLHLVTQSPFYRTQPVGPVRGQRWFLNGVVAVETRLGSQALLRLLGRIEASLGRDRRREIRWGPRRMDLDLLFHGDRVVSTPKLILPHPRLHKRRFVLQPLADVVPTWVHPIFGKTIDTLLQEVDDKSLVTQWPDGRGLF
ncbi:MAG: 2-amino-4-hydroxy-6-hydroxymethyldihydropteridine diphosphokinase [Magnetococcales bacterium]|nr:2-amino-4-hydroxy-6-hydroxymethyldihydropteridine diphosphokinase [Magnetococcales bacterium]